MKTRIKELRNAKGFTLEQFSEMTELSVSYLSRLETGKRNVDLQHLETIAKHLDVDVTDLIRPATTTIPIIGQAGLGEEIVWDCEGNMNLGEIEIPFPLRSEGLVALEGKGDSMLPRVRHGEIIIARENFSSPSHFIGEEAIVKLKDGTYLLKTIRRGYSEGRYNLESYNAAPREDQEIERLFQIVMILPSREYVKE